MMFVKSGTFFLGQEGRIRNITRDNVYVSQFVILATEECDTSNCMYFGRQIQWYIQNYLWMMFVDSGTFFLGQEGSVRNIIRDKLYLSQYVSYKIVYYIKHYLLWVTKPLVGSKLPIDKIIAVRNLIPIGVRNLIHRSGRFLLIYHFN